MTFNNLINLTGGYIYVSQSNLSANSIYIKSKRGSAKKKPKESKLVIAKVYTESPPLSESESLVLQDILESCPNVVYRKRPVQHTLIEGGEKWEMFFQDKHHYRCWLDYQRLDNRNYNGGELDHLFAIFGNGDNY